ncbi:FHA domain-containing protein [Bifidobacterium leontopitheci]|uniref:ABC transporter, ATP-binding protein n=1 Tax=Bifidobacterium leontopitheci TaxID=2650774 RepID=A0A6I1GF87_9BIFI|nr:FHA domain-containing protein [Bifidobacterium leontopitheci]KAB7790300.1 ABC transporter, ATP-binding protein [Bifidobacterium leontopitheci]
MPSTLIIVVNGVRYPADPTRPITIGRAPDCDIVIPNPHVSHHHARLQYSQRGWLLEDTNSANGLTQHGIRVPSLLITSSTSVQLCSTTTVSFIMQQPAAPRPGGAAAAVSVPGAPVVPAVPAPSIPAKVPAIPAQVLVVPAVPTRIAPAAPVPTVPMTSSAAAFPVAAARPVPAAAMPAATIAAAGMTAFPSLPAATAAPVPAMQPAAPQPAVPFAAAPATPRPMAAAPLPSAPGKGTFFTNVNTVLRNSIDPKTLEQRTTHTVLGTFNPMDDKSGYIGRDVACVIRISDVLASRRHCHVEAGADGIVLTDLNSVNGTYVNGRRIVKVWLEEGDVITIGNTDLVLHDGVIQDRSPLVSSESVIAEGIGLTVGKGAKRATLLHDVNAVFAKGTLTAVIGPSGAGKSTFTSIAAGLNSPTEGHVYFDGYDVHRNIELLRSRIGFVPQDDVVHRKLTVDAALSYAAKLRLPASTKQERREIIDNVLGELELTERRRNRIDRLSGGQRKRVSTAIELLTGPELLILDEPTSGLDPSLDKTVMEMLRKLADAGGVVLVVTHSLSYIDDMCDNVLMLAPGGYPAFFGDVRELRAAFGSKPWADIFTQVTDDPTKEYSVSDPRTRAKEARKIVNEHGHSKHERPARAHRIKQMFTLMTRQLHLVAADPGLLIFLLLLPLLLGLLSLVVPGSHGLGEPDFKDAATEPSQLLALIILGACFMGSALSVRDIVSERAIYDRERAVGLSPTSYTLSKLLVLGLETVLQAAILTAAVAVGKPHPEHGILTGSGIPELVLIVWLTAWASAMLGAVGSALVRSGEQTMPLLVVLVMAQLVFSGGMIPVTDRGGLEQVSMIFPGRWGYSAAASDIDLNGLLYGPTKVPTFKKDELWEHTTGQFWTDIGVLAVMVVLFTIVLRVCVSNMVCKNRR